MSREFSLKHYIAMASIIFLQLVTPTLNAITTLSKHDPFPVYTSLDPDIFLYMYERLKLKGLPNDRTKQEWFNISFSPFVQKATLAKDARKNEIEIGDLGGAWGMIALLFGPTPAGKVFPPSLVNAQQTLFPSIPKGTPISDPPSIDPAENFGFFEIPIEYRKRGLRFDIQAQILSDFGLELQIGLVDICQTATFTNLTCWSFPECGTEGQTVKPSGSLTPGFNNPNNTNLTAVNVTETLMDPCALKQIVKEIDLDIDNFHEVSAEDIRLGAYWRHAYPINQGKIGWPEFLVIPFAKLEGSFAVGKERRRNQAFATSFGSDDHNAIAFTAGLNVDFTETIEVGAQAGITHFFCRDFCNVPVPTHECQSGIYPFHTDIREKPGHNWNFGLKMFAYQFLDRLSFYFQYELIRHEPDEIELKKSDPAFLPDVLERRSSWTVQVGNGGFTYDISPYLSFGCLVQLPLSQRNAYRSTSFLVGFNATY